MTTPSSRRGARAARRTLSAAMAAGLVLPLLAVTSPATPVSVVPAAAVPAAEPAAGPGAVPAAVPGVSPGLPGTVTADALPTVQVDGVVWGQVVVGDRVYVTGEFANARPAGAAAGQSQTPRATLLAYDLATGELVSSWAPSLDAQGLAIAASPDGRRIYVGGDFTEVDGQSHDHVVALDAATGAVVPGFAAGVNGRVRALVTVGSTVYVGGNFTKAAGQPRTRLAAFAAADGALSAWAPVADGEVFSATAPPGAGTLVVGGRFTTLGGSDAYGLGAVDLTTAAARPFAANRVVRNAGPDAAIYGLTSDERQVYGAGYVFGAGGNLENTFAAESRTGELAWVNGCLGDTYSLAPVGDVLYTAGHPHDCAMVGGNPEVSPRQWQRAQAMTTAPSPLGRTNTSGTFAGRSAPELLHWLPTFAAGRYTGQFQGPWSVTTAGDYVVMGGEFPRVNGAGQQGLVRFAAPPAAPDASGPTTGPPDGESTITPTLTNPAAGQVRATLTAAWDRDDPELTYELLRGSGDGEVVATTTATSAWWERPTVSFADDAAPGGSLTYRVRVSDPSGNELVSDPVTVEVEAPPTDPGPPTSPTGPYAQVVDADDPSHWWRLGERAGARAQDRAGGADLALDPSARRRVAGGTGDGDLATFFTGTARVPGVTARPETGPQSFSVELWLRTTTARGGKLVGFGDSRTGPSSQYDRQLWLDGAGRLHFGVNDGRLAVLGSPTAVNDGRWHHVVATLGAGGTTLFVDGAAVASDPSTTAAQPFRGYWRVGGDTLAGWPSRPPSDAVAGSLDDVAVYPQALSADRVAAHAAAGGAGR